MAEFIGSLMVGWPTWLVFLIVTALVVIGGFISVVWYSAWASEGITFRRKKHAKK